MRSRNQYHIKVSRWFQCATKVETTAYNSISQYLLSLPIRYLHSASAPWHLNLSLILAPAYFPFLLSVWLHLGVNYFYCGKIYITNFFILKILSTQFSALTTFSFCINIITIHFQNFHIIPNRSSLSTKQKICNSPLLPAPGNLYSTSCFYKCECSSYLRQVESYSICTFMSGLFHLT